MMLPLMMRYAWREELIAKTSNGRLMALASTGLHAVCLRMMIPHLGLTRSQIKSMEKYLEMTWSGKRI